MTTSSSPTLDQLARIETTLQRIREGLRSFRQLELEEPAHLFQPEAFHDRKS